SVDVVMKQVDAEAGSPSRRRIVAANLHGVGVLRLQVLVANHLVDARRIQEAVVQLTDVRRAESTTVRRPSTHTATELNVRRRLRRDRIADLRMLIGADPEGRRDAAADRKPVLEPRGADAGFFAAVVAEAVDAAVLIVPILGSTLQLLTRSDQ